MSPCALCNDQEKKNEDDVRLAFDFTPGELLRSALHGRCDFCLLILEGLRQAKTLGLGCFEEDVRRVNARCRGQRRGRCDTLSLEVYFVDERPKLELEYCTFQPSAWEAILPRTPVSSHSLSQQALIWIKSCLNTCISTHTPCKGDDQPFLPKRVLSFQTEPDDTISVRLVEPNECSRGVYAALSHSWGKNRHCITTKQTLEERKKGIPWNTMAKSFQHAISILTKIGIEFIWIDSLCIVQDDLDDWEIESAKMAAIYSQAQLTMADTIPPDDSSSSCYPFRDPVKTIEISLPEVLGSPRIAVRRLTKHWGDVGTNERNMIFPLQSRGWAFQERLLSRRILHICRDELVWECREMSICECGGFGEKNTIPGAYQNTISLGEENTNKDIDNHNQTEERLARIFDLEAYIGEIWMGSEHPWRSMKSGLRPTTEQYESGKITKFDETFQECNDYVQSFHRTVEQYSALQLTKFSDRLPALSGLCTRMQPFRGQYAAGLWMDSISFDLLWRVETLTLEANFNMNNEEYRGPSWSWIVTPDPVRYWPDILNFFDPLRLAYPRRFKIKDKVYKNLDSPEFRPSKTTPLGRNTDKIHLELQTTGRNPLGSVARAILIVEASSTTAILKYVRDSFWHGGTNKINLLRYSLTIDAFDPRTEFTSEVDLPFFADYPLAVEGPRQVAENTVVSLLLVHPRVALVLVLVAAGSECGNEDVWRRIGIVRMSNELVSLYNVDWMRSSTVERFKIV